MKFSDAKTIVDIDIIQNETSLNVSITNHGEIMDDVIIAHIFDRFYQGDASHSGNGNGLGLSIAKRIITLHQGSITVNSSIENGTTFLVALPIK